MTNKTTTIDNLNLRQALALIRKFRNKCAFLPILNYIRIRNSRGYYHLESYDMATGVTIRIPAIADTPSFNTLVQFDNLEKLVGKLKGQDIGIEYKAGKLAISSDRTAFNLPTKLQKDFPRLPDPGADPINAQSVIPFDSLVSALKFNLPATDTEVKNFPSGALFSYTGTEIPPKDSLAIVTTDGRRLHRNLNIRGHHRVNADIPDRIQGCIVPVDFLDRLSRISLPGNPSVKFTFTDNIGTATIPDYDISLVFHMLDTPYPDYDKVIPEDFTERCILSTPEVIQAIDTLSVIASQQDGRDMFVFRHEVKSDNLTIAALSDSTGAGTVSLSAPILQHGSIDYSGPALFALNYLYFQDSIKAGNGKVEMEYSGSLEPVVFRYPGLPDRLSVIMPVRFKGELSEYFPESTPPIPPQSI
jgi:DNA polymerase-3 subunit beta